MKKIAFLSVFLNFKTTSMYNNEGIDMINVSYLNQEINYIVKESFQGKVPSVIEKFLSHLEKSLQYKNINFTLLQNIATNIKIQRIETGSLTSEQGKKHFEFYSKILEILINHVRAYLYMCKNDIDKIISIKTLREIMSPKDFAEELKKMPNNFIELKDYNEDLIKEFIKEHVNCLTFNLDKKTENEIIQNNPNSNKDELELKCQEMAEYQINTFNQEMNRIIRNIK